MYQTYSETVLPVSFCFFLRRKTTPIPPAAREPRIVIGSGTGWSGLISRPIFWVTALPKSEKSFAGSSHQDLDLRSKSVDR
ncbi:hypothetical protein FJSC11DRAFT_2479 [Fischerella thermalis JSC-11]|jgi:hypothetical protein|uniref:Uncharacterized protein n=1 Tax=Fischerella thermalis JSC-11 TaxID=741277 RepID=G6FUD2_9CYAN|nr:hypothetical protein FJSC11DRAFT_2479 [Fischerella thermalis JSC-11]